MSRVLPILFNTDMVRAILDGRKTVTRRIIKDNVAGILNSPYHKEHPKVPDMMLLKKLCRTPYHPGDILYVRETWNFVYEMDDSDQIIEDTGHYVYCADDPMPFSHWVDANTGEHKDYMPWRPSIHMPKEAARIWLKVTDVRVERLQDIDGVSVLAEGIDNGKSNSAMGKRWENMQREAFKTLWNSTIKKQDIGIYDWNANPWVWVIEFEQCEKPEGI